MGSANFLQTGPKTHSNAKMSTENSPDQCPQFLMPYCWQLLLVLIQQRLDGLLTQVLSLLES